MSRRICRAWPVPLAPHVRRDLTQRRVEEAVQQHLNAGWTLRATFPHDGYVWLIFVKKAAQ